MFAAKVAKWAFSRFNTNLIKHANFANKVDIFDFDDECKLFSLKLWEQLVVLNSS